nr:ORF2 [Torque teno felis virus]
MLPALDLSGSPDLHNREAFKKREAKWKQLVSATHKEWCLCGSFLNHFILPEYPLLKCTSDAIDVGDTIQDLNASGDAAEDRSGDVDGDPEAG